MKCQNCGHEVKKLATKKRGRGKAVPVWELIERPELRDFIREAHEGNQGLYRLDSVCPPDIAGNCFECKKPLGYGRLATLFISTRWAQLNQHALLHFGCWNKRTDREYAETREREARRMADHIEPVDLSLCACGHHATEHAADKLENLLKCSASDCECDHFHYAVPESEQSAAA